MDAPICQGCLQRDRVIAELQAQIVALHNEIRVLRGVVHELKVRLGQNSTNSSVPPAANPPGAPKPVVKRPTGRKRGGQPGHPGHRRDRLPAERVTAVIRHVPKVCAHCQAALPPAAGPRDPEPTWHQVIELPPVLAEVVEHQGHARTCRRCGQVTRAAMPAAALAHGFGPRLTSVVSLLIGRCHVSMRSVAELIQTVFGIPLALGTVARLQQEMAVALAQPHQEVLAEVRQADVKNVDESSWKLAGRLHWLWTAATQKAVAFVVHPLRGAAGLQALLGDRPVGRLCTDRWSAYNQWPLRLRQVCWAHLRRDFQKLVDRGPPAARIGDAALDIAHMLFEAWHIYRAGERSAAGCNKK